MTRCPVCSQRMRALLFSTYCPACAGEELPPLHYGWIVDRPEATLPYRAYVFQQREHAEDWARMRYQGNGVVQVASYRPYSWRTGVQATAHLIFHDTLVAIHLDNRHEREGAHAHVVGTGG